jgi:hypothetical protein
VNPWHLKRGLRAIIELLTKTHPAGFRVLLGECDPPSAEEVRNMLGALREDADPDMRVSGGGDSLPEAIRLVEASEKFNEYIDAAGGWPHICSTTREWARHYAATWGILIDHAVWVSGGFSRIDAAQMERLASKHGMSSDSIWRRIREFPNELARAILLQPSDAKEWDLDRQEGA